jgi:hypothetical protein
MRINVSIIRYTYIFFFWKKRPVTSDSYPKYYNCRFIFLITILNHFWVNFLKPKVGVGKVSLVKFVTPLSFDPIAEYILRLCLYDEGTAIGRP